MKNFAIGFVIGATLAYLLKPKKRKKEIDPDNLGSYRKLYFLLFLNSQFVFKNLFHVNKKPFPPVQRLQRLLRRKGSFFV